MKIKLVNMIPWSLNSETNNDSETNLSVNPTNSDHIAGTAFTPYGFPNTPIYLTQDGGNTWTLNAIVPGGTGDYNVKFSARALYSGNLRPVGPPRLLDMNVARTPNPYLPPPMFVIDVIPGAGWPRFYDQPWVETRTAHGATTAGDRVYVGGNDLRLMPGATATIDMTLDGIAAAPAFRRVLLDVRGTAGQDGPSVRFGVHRSGTVYAAFFGYRPPGGGTNSDVVVMRDDNWGAGATPFHDLIDPVDLNPGVRVITGINVGWFVGLGPDRTGSDLALAVDPERASHVWVTWCDVQAGALTLHVRRSTDGGRTWSQDLLTVPRAKNPGLAVNSENYTGVLYQQLTGTWPVSGRWEEHLQITRSGRKWHDHLLANTSATVWTGDYAYLMTHGREFYGIFAADNTPDIANFPHGVRYQRNANFTTRQLFDVSGTIPIRNSIDPFFFKAYWEEEEGENEEELEHFRGVRVKGLKYERLEIDELNLPDTGEGSESKRRVGRRVSRLLRRMASEIGREAEE
jgi:hypothetical protein